jgi:hypothetical protein
MAKNAATESAPKAGAACGKEKTPAPEKFAKKKAKADSKQSKGAKK